MEATKMTKSELKKGVNELFNEVFASPFKVISFIKKYKNDPRIIAMLDYYGVKSISLDMLLTYDNDTDRPVFCELKKVSDINFLSGYELKVIQLGNNYYEYVPVSFSVNDFFKSLDSMNKIKRDEVRKVKKAEKELEKEAKKEAKAASKKAMKEEKEAKKIAEKAKALASEYSDIPENILIQIAAKVLAA